jgi:predicted RNA-binding Zn ribbon-like protein
MLSQARKPVKAAQADAPPKFKFVGGSLSIDFVNTVGGRDGSHLRGSPIREKLRSFADLVRWSELAGTLGHAEAARLLSRAAKHPRAAQIVLARSLKLREALYRIFKSEIDGRAPLKRDVTIFNREIEIAHAQQTLTHHAGEFAWRWKQGGGLDRTLWPVTIDAARLLTSDSFALLRRCQGKECGWMFVDNSRNRSRHWCDMRDCGNRAKVASFRQRLRG